MASLAIATKHAYYYPNLHNTRKYHHLNNGMMVPVHASIIYKREPVNKRNRPISKRHKHRALAEAPVFDLGAVITQGRLRHYWSRAELATRIGVTEKQIADAETNDSVPNSLIRRRLEERLNVRLRPRLD